jgi:hypothetical protein
MLLSLLVGHYRHDRTKDAHDYSNNWKHYEDYSTHRVHDGKNKIRQNTGCRQNENHCRYYAAGSIRTIDIPVSKKKYQIWNRQQPPQYKGEFTKTFIFIESDKLQKTLEQQPECQDGIIYPNLI